MAYRSKRKAAINAQLGDYVMGRLSEARTAWAPEYARMLKCCRLMRGLPYLPDDELMGNITFPVVPAITQAVEAAILDVFGDAISAPFTLKPSELPDLPPNIVQFLSQLLQQNIGMLEQVTGGDPAKVPLALQGLRETVKQQLEERATDAAGQMTDTIKTRMLQGSWTKAFTDFISNLTIYPTAILKGPYLKTIKARRWDETTGKLVFEDKAVWSFSNVNPFYFYPAPQAASVEEAEYVIEVQRIGAVDFAYLGLTDNYDADSVQDVQQEYPDGHLEPFFMGGERSPDYDFLQNAMSANIDTQGFYDVVCFSGRISGSILNALGGYNLNEYEWYKAEVEVCAGHVLKAVLNPNPSGNSRYHAMSLFPVAGSFFGESVPTRLLDVQRACEAALRALMRNMSYSSGPIFEVDIDRVSNDDDPTFIEPGVVKFTKQKWSGQNIPAYHVYNIPSHAAEIDNLMDKFIERGFTIIGFTPVSLGGQGEASTSRTVGGMSIQLNQSSKPLKKIVSTLGRDIITPAVQDLTDMEMMTSQDTSILGDILVHPTGVEGLADDEAKATRIQQAIQSCAGLAQFLSQPANPLTPLVMHLFSTWLKLEGIPTDGLQNFGMQDAFAQDTGAAYAGGTGQPNPAAPPMPQLDGRSGGAGPAISTNNDLSATMGGRSP